MKTLIILILSICIACNNVTEQGFVNKAEAKNEVVNGVKEGKWVEYFVNEYGDTTLDSNHYFSYSLTVYKNGEPIGLERIYFKSGERMEVPHTNGRVNGLSKGYYKSGELKFEQSWENNRLNGMVKSYYKSGKLKSEAPFKDGFENGIEKQYYESEILKSETSYKNGDKGATINYDETGKPTYSITIDSNLSQ
jgi:antitoxin component YwqK of YwqJK toxin-antitoxin module